MLKDPLHCDLSRLEDTLSSPRRVDIVLLCADVVGFTKMTERVGDTDSLAIMRRIAKLIRAEARLHEGTELEIRGDSFLISFDSPYQGVSCASAIQRTLLAHAASHPRESVRVRIALHAGQVLREGTGYFGLNVILPFRVLSVTGEDQIAITSQVIERLNDSWHHLLTNEQSFRPKGFDADVRFCLVDWCDPAFSRVASDPAAGAREGGISTIRPLAPCSEGPLELLAARDKGGLQPA